MYHYMQYLIDILSIVQYNEAGVFQVNIYFHHSAVYILFKFEV